MHWTRCGLIALSLGAAGCLPEPDPPTPAAVTLEPVVELEVASRSGPPGAGPRNPLGATGPAPGPTAPLPTRSTPPNTYRRPTPTPAPAPKPDPVLERLKALGSPTPPRRTLRHPRPRRRGGGGGY